MRIAVFGLGYVGTVTAACLAARGHRVIGVDVNDRKVGLIIDARTPVLEPGLSELVESEVRAGRLTATTDAITAVSTTDIALVCVGTPSLPNGSLDTKALVRTATNIGDALRERAKEYTVVVRSTVLPGTTETVVVPALEEASRRRGSDGSLGIAVNPEFLREGTSLRDFADPPKTVIGSADDATGDILDELYGDVPGPRFRVPLRVAEMIKYADNSFHALKITFANEIGTLCREFGIDSHSLMNVFLADTKLNISPAYLRPGFAFGGSCLPKDLRALVHAAKRADVSVPVLESILPSNERHLQRIVDAILLTGHKKIGIAGLSFKPGTDDLRESPLVELAERLLGKGCTLKIYDSEVSMSRLVGANREYVDSHIPHLSALLVETAEDAMRDADICIVGAPTPEVLETVAAANGRMVIDLVRLPDAAERRVSEEYVGVAW
jgi:GDP-mannose 6-dehydrogenase